MGRTYVRLLASSRDRRDVAVRLGAALFGAATGAVTVWLIWRSQGARLGVTNLDASRVAHNTKLLLETCGPWAFGMTSYYARVSMDYAPWDMHPAYALFAKAGGCVFLAFFPAALLLALTKRRLRFASRRAGVVGALALPLTLYGFLTSVMVMDHFSMRYLASIPLLAPFAPKAGSRPDHPLEKHQGNRAKQACRRLPWCFSSRRERIQSLREWLGSA